MSDDPNNWTINYYYNIRWKGPFEVDWHELYLVSDYNYPRQEYESDFTMLQYECAYSFIAGLEFVASSIGTTFPIGAQVDFQVEAMIGYVFRQYAGDYGPFSFPYVFTGEISGWSSTQPLTIGEITQTVSPIASQSAAPPSENPISGQVFGLDLWQVATIVLVAVVVLSVFVLFYLRRRSVGHQSI